jgi:hypothetical protein
MPVPLDVSIFLNNALSAKHLRAELESDTPLPETIREMPESISGQFVALDESGAAEIAAAWKQTMILNTTRVLYTFTFDPASGKFAARKR